MTPLPGLRRFPALAAILLLACGPGVVEPDDAHPALRTSVVPDASWGEVSRDAFSYAVPPGFQDLGLQPIDSDAVTHADGSSSLHHDYGWYTGPWRAGPTPGGDPVLDFVRQEVRIGGRRAEVVSYRLAGRWVVRAWWGRVRVQGGQAEDLLLRGETPDEAVREQLLAAIYSVRFR